MTLGDKRNLYLPLSILVLLLVTLVLVRWWQLVFKDSFEREQESAIMVLEKDMLIASTNKAKLKQLLTDKKVEQVDRCSQVPCNFSGAKFFQARQDYLDLLENQKEKRINMIRWETGFLITVLFSVTGFMIYMFLRERRQFLEQEKFISMTTHELKHPITSVSLILQSLGRDTIKGQIKATLISKGLSEIKALNQQIENLIQMKQIESLATKEKEPYLLKDLIERINQRFLESGLPAERVRLASEIEGILVNINRRGLELLLVNLLENALKYSQKYVNVTVQKARTNLALEIIDEGIGFTEEEKKQMGKLFYRSKRHEVQNKKGAGIGLYTVYRLAKVLNVTVDLVESSPEQGSKFRLKMATI